MIRAIKEQKSSKVKTLKQLGFSKFIEQLRRLWQSSTKQLSMVFFVGRGRAHTFRIPLVLVYTLLAVAGASTVWSVVSTGLLIFFFNQNNWLESQLNMTRGIVLKYQAQYERVFERTYPQLAQNPAANAMENAELDLQRSTSGQGKDDAKTKSASNSQEKAIAALAADEAPDWNSEDTEEFSGAPDNNRPAENLQAAGAPSPGPSAVQAEVSAPVARNAEQPTPPIAEIKSVPTVVAVDTPNQPNLTTAASANTPEIAASTAVPNAAKPQPKAEVLAESRSERSDLLRPEDLTVRDLRMAPTDLGLDVHFNLQNSGRLPKAQGYLTIIGEMTLDSGEKIFQVAPEMPGFDPKTGKVTDFKRGESFAAARFRSSRMTLLKPAGAAGRFTAVRIVLTDREGRIADETTKEVKQADVATRAPAADGG